MRREKANLAAADGVICITAADCSSLISSHGHATVRASAVVRWGHPLLSAADVEKGVVPAPGGALFSAGDLGISGKVDERAPPWRDRSGILFVGLADNPTNAVGLAWFFAKARRDRSSPIEESMQETSWRQPSCFTILDLCVLERGKSPPRQ